MTAVWAVVAAGLLLALVLVLATQRRLSRRLIVAGRRLAGDVVPTGAGLAEATSVVERGVDRALLQRGDVSVAEQRLAGALGMIPQGVVVFGPGRAVVFRNEVAARYVAALSGEALVDEAIDELAAEVLAGGGRRRPTRTLELFGPPRRTLVLEGATLEHQGQALGVVVVIDDVTDRRRLEAVRRDFVANISHELKTPVGALGLLAETLVAEPDPAVAHRLAERMVTEAFRVAHTIDDLLELSRIEGAEGLSRDDVPVHRMIAEAVARVQGAADQLGISLEVQAGDDRLAVPGDRRQLVSATYNLLDNAVKYSDRGSAVQVSTRAEGDWVEIAVRDHGVGIPQRDTDRVFERFYRVDRARSRETGGTGLGLAIVRHVASNHGGEVTVISTEGAGSTFTLRLPAAGGRPRGPAGSAP